MTAPRTIVDAVSTKVTGVTAARIETARRISARLGNRLAARP
jgi:hypothetical protein